MYICCYCLQQQIVEKIIFRPRPCSTRQQGLQAFAILPSGSQIRGHFLTVPSCFYDSVCCVCVSGQAKAASVVVYSRQVNTTAVVADISWFTETVYTTVKDWRRVKGTNCCRDKGTEEEREWRRISRSGVRRRRQRCQSRQRWESTYSTVKIFCHHRIIDDRIEKNNAYVVVFSK